MTFLQSFGPQLKVITLPLAPLWLYTRHELYSSFMSSLEYPSFLFPLCLLLPFSRPPKALRWLAAGLVIRFALWGLSSQQTWFLLPLFPGLAVLSAYTLDWLAGILHRSSVQRILSTGLIGSLLVVTLIYLGVFWAMTRPGPVLVGMESRDAFLRRNASTYAVQAFIQTELSPNARVLMLWDGQTLYCDRRCVPDTEQTQWTRLVVENNTVDAVVKELRQMGITHLLVNGFTQFHARP